MNILSAVLVFALFLLSIGSSYADQTLTSQKVDEAPVIDGLAADKVWDQARAITTHDKVADVDIILKTVYTDKKVFFLVTYQDEDESVNHRRWIWDKKNEEYKQGKDREDVLVLKWNMEDKPVDLSIHAENTYKADIWFWKACRTNPEGYADDKYQILSSYKIKKATEVKSKTGKKMYLRRSGDVGKSAFISHIYVDYKGDIIPRFKTRQPSESRADVKAKGVWKSGQWTIEFSRDLTTSHKEDDIQLDPMKTYLFGVSRYEIAGRDAEPDSDQPLYGSGDVTKKLYLEFSR